MLDRNIFASLFSSIRGKVLTTLTGTLVVGAMTFGAVSPANAWDAFDGTPPTEPECTMIDAALQNCEDTYLYRQIQIATALPSDPIEFNDKLYEIKLNYHGVYATMLGFHSLEEWPNSGTDMDNVLAMINSSSSPEQFKCYRAAMQHWAIQDGKTEDYVKYTRLAMEEGFARMVSRSISYGGRTPVEEWSTPGNEVTYNDVVENLPYSWIGVMDSYMNAWVISQQRAQQIVNDEMRTSLSANFLACNSIYS